MGLTDSIKKICHNLGTNNKPTYVVMAIATVKGIARPTFTMMDKTENPETKKYTALREGLTEVIAIPAYWACGELSAKAAEKLFPQKTTNGAVNPALLKAKKNLMFMGVCAAALFIIPGTCSVVIKPIMDKLGLKAPEKKQPKPELSKNTTLNTNTALQQPKPINQTININNNKYNTLNTYANRPQVGLRVGGL